MVKDLRFPEPNDSLALPNGGGMIELKASHLPHRGVIQVKSPTRKNTFLDEALLGFLILIGLASLVIGIKSHGITRAYGMAMFFLAGFATWSVSRKK
ncbi:hypothetical protein [Alicyclobacillus sp. ALC3]|uniref:hypothetical protein n=1 Tax=Alicyclobacillus sp. ALC3 TaxID=2796143 RepID=UPI002379134E|nr:hypothetical protein [Alicyclobacillus sp. ALC3]WDL98165.1 hypothetical protein JC200_05540 [Alicyclobacillus sp. ALC3]